MRRPWVPALILLAGGLTAGWLLLSRAAAPDEPLQPTRLFEQVMAHVRRYGVDSMPESELYRRAADGLLGQLDDEYATLLPEGAVAGLTEATDVAGLGILLSTRDSRITVLGVLPGSSADSAGVARGDQLLEADGRPLDPGRRDQILAALAGPPGTTLALRVRRPGAGLISFELTRAEPRSVVVTPFRIRDSIGYLAVRLLGPGSAMTARRELEGLVREGAKGLILDLRGTSQGSLEEGIALADLLLDPGAGVVEVRGRDPEPRRVGDDRPQDRRFASMPVVVLVDSSTADAAEVVAGALQDNDRALLIGQPSYGRGLSPETFPLANRTIVRISTGRWYTPSGRPIQRDTAASDTLSQRPTVASAGGRQLYAGGSIVPDSLLPTDSLPAGQVALLRAINSDYPRWRQVARQVAAGLAPRGRVTVDAVPTAEQLETFRLALDSAGVVIPEDVWRGGIELARRRLGDEMVRAGLGERRLLERQLGRDRAVTRAVDLLRGVKTPTQLTLGR